MKDSPSIQHIVGNIFLKVSLITLLITLIAAFCFDHLSLTEEKKKDSQGIHQAISSHIVSALTSANIDKIHTALNLVSSSNQIFIINAQGHIFLPDVNQLGLTKITTSTIERN